MGVSKNRGTQKWMVYNGSNPIKMDDLGVPLLTHGKPQGKPYGTKRMFNQGTSR